MEASKSASPIPALREKHFCAALDRVPGLRCVLGLFEGVVTGAADGYGRMRIFPPPPCCIPVLGLETDSQFTQCPKSKKSGGQHRRGACDLPHPS
ncbi:MAG: hypothetical protein Ct9H90mP9_5660 [Pseudomonadota bacterium]|nr:MAG: hypothetical protein Ct9H90mP9_5660 [Pseudomonadota bacterium]